MTDLPQFNDFGHAVLITDLKGKITYWNKAAEELYGYTREEAIGQVSFSFISDADAVSIKLYKRNILSGKPASGETRMQSKSGKAFICYYIASPLYDKNEKLIGRIAITSKKRETTLTEDMLFFLNKASEELSSTLDYNRTLSKITELIVPRLADWFAISVPGQYGYLKNILVAHKDPEKLEWAKKFIYKYPTKMDSNVGSAKVLRTGESEFFSSIPQKFLKQAAQDEEHYNFIQKLGIHSAMTVPMKASGKIKGVISFISAEESGKQYSEEDLPLAEDFARRVALTLENIQLYEDSQEEIKIRKEIEKALKHNEQRFRTIIEALPQMAFSATPEGRANFFNQRWYDYTGLSLFDQKPDMWASVLHENDINEFLNKWDSSIKNGRAFEQELRFRYVHSGEYKWHLMRAVPVKDPEGQISQWVGTCTDINDQKLLNAKKDEFLNVASHELKTPLATSKAYVQLIEKEIKNFDNQKLTKYSSKANYYLNVLNNLIMDLLDIGKIESGKMQYKKVELDINELIQECITNAKYENADADIKMHGRLGKPVYADRNRLEQILNNLISNAIKYSGQEKKVDIYLSQNKDHYQVKVIDSGVGISKENQKRIFDRYYRIKENHSASDGLGLGLYISSEIAHRHGGDITVESTRGVGSTFTLTLPINKLP